MTAPDDELEHRVRDLEAERARPTPRPPTTGGGSLVGLQRLLDLQADELANDTTEEAEG